MKPPVVNRALLAPKLAYFFFYFSYSSVTPYIAVFMSVNGLNPEQCGYIIGGRLFAQFLSGLVWGAIADRTRKNRLLLIIQILVSTAVLFSSPWIPLALPNTASSSTACQLGTVNGNLSYTGIARNSTQLWRGQFSKKQAESSNRTGHVIQPETTLPKAYSIKSTPNAILRDKANASRTLTPTSTKPTKEPGACKRSTQALFIVMVVLFILVGIFEGGILLLIDSYVIHLIERVPGCEFGKQRLWGAVGFGIASFASGVGINLSGGGGPNYFTMFYIYLASNTILMIPCFFMDTTIHLDKGHPKTGPTNESRDKPKVAIVKEVAVIFKKFNVVFFFVTILMMGMADSLLNSYLFLYIHDLRGSEMVMGLSIVVSTTSEALIFPFTDKIIKTLHGNLISIAVAFAMYSLRFLGYSLVQNPWHILPIQVLHCVCFALFWAASVYHTKHLAPDGLKSTFLAILNGTYFGISGGTASIVGGIIYKSTGGRTLFRGYSVVLLVWAILLVLHIAERCKKKKISRRQLKFEDEQDEEEMNELSPREDLIQKAETA